MPIFVHCATCRQPVLKADIQQHRKQHQRERGSWSPDRDRSAQAKFHRAVLKAAGHRCQATLSNGVRCPITRPLFAHHRIKGTYDPSAGVALCRYHHREVDSYAR